MYSGKPSIFSSAVESEIFRRLDQIQKAIDELARDKPAKEFYSVAEIAALLGKAEFTAREWCRHRRLRAGKKRSGRGRAKEWAISHEELIRYQREGLLPRQNNNDARGGDAR
jgi:hypothetical protein